MVTKERMVRLFKFGIVGSSGILVNNGILFLLVYLRFEPYFASPIAIAVAIFNNFTWNDVWTWGEERESRHFSYLQRLLRYYISASLGAGINYALLLILTYIFHVELLLANLTGIAFGMISNFLLGEFWVFRKKRLWN